MFTVVADKIVDLSFIGASGTKNRTYTLSKTPTTNSLMIHIDGTFLHVDTDYTLAAKVITFKNNVFDTSDIHIFHFNQD